jgi:hypothetical protein
MRWIVTPLVAAAAIATDIGAVAALDIGVAVEIVIHVDVDVTAAPTTAPAPAAAPGRAHRDTDAEGYSARCYNCSGSVVRRVVDRRIGISRRAVDDSGVIGRHIHHFWT